MHFPRHLYGILGHPLGHSLSPLLHNWGFALLRQRAGQATAQQGESTDEAPDAASAGVYLPFDKTPEELPEFMRAVRSLPIAGLSVTLPHKEAVRPFVDEVTERAARAGAVNTLFWKNGALVGENTDVEGFIAPLHEKRTAPTLILGAGGVARAALAGLAELRRQAWSRQAGTGLLQPGRGDTQPAALADVAVAARNPHKAAGLAQEFGCRILPWEERLDYLRSEQPSLVINATPLGMRGRFVRESPLPEEAWALLPSASLAYDTVYNPLETRFLAEARARGLAVQDGLTLFVAQGLAQFRLWTGRRLPPDEARALIASALRGTSQAAAAPL